MEWEDIMSHGVEKDSLEEWRGRIMKSQKKQLKQIEDELGIPQAAIVRMALKTFLPLTENRGYKMSGIKNLWNDKKF